MSKTLTELGGSDGSIAVGSDGTVYAAGVARVLEFVDGSTKPKQTLRVSEVVGLALDGKNDLYVENRPCAIGCGPGNVFEFEPGSRRRKNLGLEANLIAGLAVDEHGDLLVGGFQTRCLHPLRPSRASSSSRRAARRRSERSILNGTCPTSLPSAAARISLPFLYPTVSSAQVNVYDYATGALAWTVTQGSDQRKRCGAPADRAAIAAATTARRHCRSGPRHAAPKRCGRPGGHAASGTWRRATQMRRPAVRHFSSAETERR